MTVTMIAVTVALSGIGFGLAIMCWFRIRADTTCRNAMTGAIIAMAVRCIGSIPIPSVYWRFSILLRHF